METGNYTPYMDANNTPYMGASDTPCMGYDKGSFMVRAPACP